tara:strand:- start:345 stop:467 length:123 start_codon:yes stop_codon:yes gene_type:complete
MWPGCCQENTVVKIENLFSIVAFAGDTAMTRWILDIMNAP